MISASARSPWRRALHSAQKACRVDADLAAGRRIPASASATACRRSRRPARWFFSPRRRLRYAEPAAGASDYRWHRNFFLLARPTRLQRAGCRARDLDRAGRTGAWFSTGATSRLRAAESVAPIKDFTRSTMAASFHRSTCRGERSVIRVAQESLGRQPSERSA